MYERSNGIFFLMVIELLLFSIPVSAASNSLLIGIIAFIGGGILYFIPILGQTMGIITSLIEAYFLFELLGLVELFNTIERVFFCIIIFLILIYLHNRTVEVENLYFVGFGWLLFEVILLSTFLYYLENSIWLSFVTLFILIILAVIPWIRVLDFIGLSVFAGVFTYDTLLNTLGYKYTFWASLIIFIYSIVMYAYVYKSLDYIGSKKYRKRQQETAEHLVEYNIIRGNVYAKYPEAEKVYYYFKTLVCVDEVETDEFETDWEKYIYYLNDNEYIAFNNFFEQNKMYQYRFYNRDYANNNCRQDDLKSQEKEARAHEDKGDKI